MKPSPTPPGLRILISSIERNGPDVRLRVRTHCAQAFDLFFTPALARKTGLALCSQARTPWGESSPVTKGAAG